MIDFDVTAIRGPYQVRKADQRKRHPRVKYMTFSAAEAAAARLIEANPGETFVITQEVARVARHVRAVRP